MGDLQFSLHIRIVPMQNKSKPDDELSFGRSPQRRRSEGPLCPETWTLLGGVSGQHLENSRSR